MNEISDEEILAKKRIRHHLGTNYYLSADELKIIPPNYPPIYKSIDWNRLYANSSAPDFIDLGCGKGKFLEQTAREYPEKNLLGIELRQVLVNQVNNTLKSKNINNCFALWYNLANGLDFINTESIEKLFYLFPDPWYKKKHHKRRALTTSLLNDIYRILKPNSLFYLATDVEEVNKYHIEILNEFQLFTVEIIQNDDYWNLSPTNKESFCIRKNIKCFKIICKKRGE